MKTTRRPRFGVSLAVEAPVQDEVQRVRAEDVQQLHRGPQRRDVGDVAPHPAVVGRQAALLAEKHRQIDLRQALAVAGVPVLDVFVAPRVRRDRGDVVTQVIALRHLSEPEREEPLAVVLRDLEQQLADALAGEHAAADLPVSWRLLLLVPVARHGVDAGRPVFLSWW